MDGFVQAQNGHRTTAGNNSATPYFYCVVAAFP